MTRRTPVLYPPVGRCFSVSLGRVVSLLYLVPEGSLTIKLFWLINTTKYIVFIIILMKTGQARGKIKSCLGISAKKKEKCLLASLI